MAFPIIPKRRSGATGNPASLQVGELAVNTLTGELFLGGDSAVMLLNPPTSAGTTATEHTGDGTTVAFTFTGYNGTADGGYLVSVGGIDQPPSKYSVSSTAGGTITFVEAPIAGELISIRAIVAGGGGGGGGITELTGDVTASGTGSVAATLASVTTAQANVGSATAIPVLSVDEKGRVTELTTVQFGGLTTAQIAGLSTTAPAALSTTAIAGLSSFAARADHAHLLPSAADVGALGATAAAGGDLAGNYPNPTLAAITTAQSNIGSSSVVPVLSVDTKGRVTSLTTAQISAGGFTVAALQTTSLTLDATYAQKIIPFQAVAPTIVTLPADVNAAISLGSKVEVCNLTTQEVTFLAGSGATMLSTGLNAIASQNQSATATKLATNTWILSGDLSTSTTVDPFFSSVSALLHMNGANGGTSFPDNSLNAYAVTAVNGATTSTAQVKFGTASYLGGATARYLNIHTDNTPFAFGTGDFTVEFWVRITATGGAQNLITLPGTSNSIAYNTGTGVVYITGGITRITSTSTGTNVWTHVAVARGSGTTRMFINGVVQGTTFADSTDYTAAGTLCQLGGSTGSAFIGNIDDFRVTKGVCRYTTSFSAPIAQFPDM
jgi:hypothetical protein